MSYIITPTTRWVRVPTCSSHHEGWDQIPTFRFDHPDGRQTFADMLDDEDVELLRRQEKQRAEILDNLAGVPAKC